MAAPIVISCILLPPVVVCAGAGECIPLFPIGAILVERCQIDVGDIGTLVAKQFGNLRPRVQRTDAPVDQRLIGTGRNAVAESVVRKGMCCALILNAVAVGTDAPAGCPLY